MQLNVLEAYDLKKSFGPLKAVNGVSLALTAGKCLALLGPNGAGKTTCVEMLEGLQSADAGRILVFGQTYEHSRRTILERVGVTLQESYLYKRFTVRETLDLFASFYKKRTNVTELIASLGLEEKANVRLHKLSGGQKQRVYLGCSLVNDPELLFLDEPTAGLDPQARRFTWDILKAQLARGRSIVLTTHFMDEAAYLADDVAIMDGGLVIAQGRVDELISKYAGERQLVIRHRDLSIAQRQELDGVLNEHNGSQSSHSQWSDQEWIVDLNVDVAKILVLLAPLLKKYDQQILDLNIRSKTLEDVFLKITGRSLRDA